MALIWNKNVMNDDDAHQESRFCLPVQLGNRTNDHRQPNYVRLGLRSRYVERNYAFERAHEIRCLNKQ